MLLDKDIRDPLCDYLEKEYGIVRFFEEIMIGKARSDLVMVTDQKLIGIEIKSDADTYVRLKNQVREYDKYFDMNLVCVGSKHSAHIEQHVPKYWGILIVEQEGEDCSFYCLRKPLVNPKLKREKKITLMWRPELAELLIMNSLPAYKQKSKAFVQQKLLEKVKAEILDEQMCNLLFERDYTLIEEQILNFKKM